MNDDHKLCESETAKANYSTPFDFCDRIFCCPDSTAKTDTMTAAARPMKDFSWHITLYSWRNHLAVTV